MSASQFDIFVNSIEFINLIAHTFSSLKLLCIMRYATNLTHIHINLDGFEFFPCLLIYALQFNIYKRIRKHVCMCMGDREMLKYKKSSSNLLCCTHMLTTLTTLSIRNTHTHKLLLAPSRKKGPDDNIEKRITCHHRSHSIPIQSVTR